MLARRTAVVVTAVLTTLAAVLALAPPAGAAYYNEYADVAGTPDSNGATAAQGFAAGSTYLYSVKTRSKNDDDRAVIYRVNKDTGARTVMTNGTDKRAWNTWLGHANDMTIVDIDDQHHLFVVTMRSSGAQLVKLRYSGTTYYKVGSYAVKYAGKTKAVSGISRTSVTGSSIGFLFKSGRSVYRASLPLRANSGTITLAKPFTLRIDDARVDGAKVSDLGSFSNQGFFYDAAEKTLYYPLTKDNRSIVLVYRGITPTTTGARSAEANLSFRITSKKYTKFEIEGVGLSGGKLWFSTNRSGSGGAADGVHRFKGYTA